MAHKTPDEQKCISIENWLAEIEAMIFDDLSREEIDSLFSNPAVNAKSRFENHLNNLISNINCVDPVQCLAYLAFNFLTTTLDDISIRAKGSDTKISLSHVELLQAMLLRCPLDMYLSAITANFDKIIEDLEKSMVYFQLKNLSNFDPEKAKIEIFRNSTIVRIRASTATVRNWGYPENIRKIVIGIFSSLEEEVIEKYGVNISFLLDMFNGVIRECEKRMSNAYSMRHILCSDNTREVAIKIGREEGRELQEAIDDYEQLNSAMIQLLYEALPELYTFSLNDFIDLYPGHIEKSKLKAVVDKWTLKFGDLFETNTESLFLDNPIWGKPFILLDCDHYFVPNVNLLNSHCMKLMESLINDDSKQRHERSRALFLEDEINRLFESGFPGAKTYRNLIFCIENSYYENDLLVIVDKTAFVIEAKSGRLSDSALRGGPKRLKRDINKLIVEPNIQSARLAELILNNDVLHLESKDGTRHVIETSQIKNIIRLSITLDTLSILSPGIMDLVESGFIDSKKEIAPVISLPDLEIIFELLQGACEKIHYFIRRNEFEKQKKFIGDEIDLLSFYLTTGFAWNTSSDDLIIINGKGRCFDRYFLKEASNIEITKPSREMTGLWKEILTGVEFRRSPGWSEFGIFLLDIGINAQREIGDLFLTIKKNITTAYDQKKVNNIVFYKFSRGDESRVISFIACKNLSEQEMLKMAQNHLRTISQNSEFSKALFICIDVLKTDRPYSVIGMFQNDTWKLKNTVSNC